MAGETRQYSIDDFVSAEEMLGASFSPDSAKILVTSDRTGIYNAFAIPVKGGEPVQLTHSTTDAVIAESYFPSDERLVYTSDRGGDELTHVYVREVDGSARDLTPGDKLKATFLGWTASGKYMVIASNERDPRHFDLYELDTTTYERTLFFRNDDGYAIGADSLRGALVSPDRRYLALVKVNSFSDTDIYLVDRTRKRTRYLTPHKGNVYHAPAAFSGDSRSLYLLTDKDHEYRYLIRQDLSSFERKVIEKPNGDVRAVVVSRGGRYAAVAVSTDGVTDMHLYDAEDDTRVGVPALDQPGILLVNYSRGDGGMALYAQGGRTPGDLYHWTIGSDEAPRRLSHRLPHSIDPANLVEPGPVRFTSFDGVTIPGVLYMPLHVDAGQEAPAVIIVHGGPGGQSVPEYDFLAQLLANRGYVVYAINNRGSSGYGKTFFGLDDGRHGEADLDDCVAAKKMLADTGRADPDRITILGASYGGYLVCAALAFRPEAFRAGVDLSGPTNWLRTLPGLPTWWAGEYGAYLREIGDPATQKEYLERISPLTRARDVVRSLLVVQGARDPRVSKAESDEWVAALRAHGAPVEYRVFEDEGHTILKRANRARVAEDILNFLDRHLKGS